MRIALVSQEYPPASQGGIGTQTRCKAHGLAARGHEVEVLSVSKSDEPQEEREGRVHVVRLPGSRAYLQAHTEACQWMAHSISVAAALAELNSKQPLDLIDFAEWGSEGYIFLLNRTCGNFTPVVIQLHGPLAMLAETINWPSQDCELYRVGVHMEGTCLRLADAIYSSSRCSSEWCQRQYCLDASQIPILHTGVDTRRFHPLKVEQSLRPTIIFVGKAVANKGVEALTRAACRLSNVFPDLQLQMIGGGEPAVWERVMRIVQAAGCQRLLERPGVVEHNQLPEFLSRAHVFAAPSEYEGGPGFVYLEAMACGLPVIACSGSGASEVVSHGENGLLVPPRDENALVEAIRLLLSDVNKRLTMGARARHYVVEHFDSEDCLSRLEAFYIAAARNSPRSRSA